ncbi:uncharacterized protein K460DRAFT_407436 [Cucurbitaria berberidis CBS 394.84]|uniref:Mid2 domain-containing protein n=1 Tax=Cucurbitaria berberidis CBS 394.84 TaxID=1168544 RepID=A0A9P4L695_9PLEO|nr:uncharacterized protein K460DRAFT_407436 [Cucurbitaria berberidis CBS 394.84]KAF1843064.1 hypothetical protein K460DRAFT_407436 [Cucurbitaria berberidis CBS 394.84]
MAALENGFAIRRNGTCINGLEVDCGITLAPYHGCCPTGLSCPSQYNIACCPPGNNCTESLITAPEPKCANATWDLYNNGGYFCCDHGLIGYNTSRGTNGCASPGAKLESGIKILSLVKMGGEASRTSTASSSSSPATTTPSNTQSASPSPPADPGSSTPVGAIAGGVVGGVAAIALALLAWYLLRRRKQNKAEGNPYDMQQLHEADATLGTATKYRMDMDHNVHEVDGSSSDGYARELSAQQKPVELPASDPVVREAPYVHTHRNAL